MQPHTRIMCLSFLVLLASLFASCGDNSSGITSFSLSASFTVSTTSGTAPLTVTFQDTSTGGTSEPITYQWMFGDGQSETNMTGTAVHVYSAPGVYQATLQVTQFISSHLSPATTITVGVRTALSNSSPVSSTSVVLEIERPTEERHQLVRRLSGRGQIVRERLLRDLHPLDAVEGAENLAPEVVDQLVVGIEALRRALEALALELAEQLSERGIVPCLLSVSRLLDDAIADGGGGFLFRMVDAGTDGRLLVGKAHIEPRCVDALADIMTEDHGDVGVQGTFVLGEARVAVDAHLRSALLGVVRDDVLGDLLEPRHQRTDEGPGRLQDLVLIARLVLVEPDLVVVLLQVAWSESPIR